MFWFNRQASKEDIERYSLMLKHMAMEDKCNDYDRLKMMRDFVQDKNFATKQIGEAQRKACYQIWDEIMEDGLVSEEEQSKFQRFLTLCNQLSEGEVARWNKKMSSNLNLYNITVKNILPVCDSRDVNIVFKKGEILHYASYADVMKTKTVTKSINYSGPSASIRICKGVRYRVGSINVSRKTESFKTSEACGIFWITNQRVGFLASSKAFVCPIDKIYAVSGGRFGLQIYKEGRSNPYILHLSDYEEPCAILSNLINQM